MLLFGFNPFLEYSLQIEPVHGYPAVGHIRYYTSYTLRSQLECNGFSAITIQGDVVIGSRFVKGSRYTGRPRRALMSRVASMACNFAQPGAHWSDWTSGFRAFTAPALQALLGKRYFAKMHGWQIEVLAHAGHLGLEIAEAPISYRAGRSAFNRHIANEAFLVWLDIFFRIAPFRKANRA